MESKLVILIKPVISEMRSYDRPPTIVKKVIEATFLLLGEPINTINVSLENFISQIIYVFRLGQRCKRYLVNSVVIQEIIKNAFNCSKNFELLQSLKNRDIIEKLNIELVDSNPLISMMELARMPKPY